MDDFESSVGGDHQYGAGSVTSDRYDWGETAASTAVLETTAAASGRDVLELPPLYETIDPDALDAVFDFDRAGDAHGPQVEVWFVYADHRVTVRADGEVRVE